MNAHIHNIHKIGATNVVWYDEDVADIHVVIRNGIFFFFSRILFKFYTNGCEYMYKSNHVVYGFASSVFFICMFNIIFDVVASHKYNCINPWNYIIWMRDRKIYHWERDRNDGENKNQRQSHEQMNFLFNFIPLICMIISMFNIFFIEAATLASITWSVQKLAFPKN